MNDQEIFEKAGLRIERHRHTSAWRLDLDATRYVLISGEDGCSHEREGNEPFLICEHDQSAPEFVGLSTLAYSATEAVAHVLDLGATYKRAAAYRSASPALQPKGEVSPAQRWNDDTAEIVSPLRFENSEAGRTAKLVASLLIEADTLAKEGHEGAAKYLRLFAQLAPSEALARLAHELRTKL